MESKNELTADFAKFGSNVVKLISGRVAAQVLAILVMPIITRMYSPDDLGLYQIFVSITAVIIVIASLQYEMAIMLPRENREAINILVLSVVIVIIVSFLTFGGILLLKDYIVVWFKAPGIISYLWFAPIAVFTGGLLHVFTQWSSREKQFGRIAVSGITSSISTSTVKLTVGAIGKAGPGGLIGGHIIGPIVGVLVLVTKSLFNSKELLSNVKISKIKLYAKRFKNFPLYSSWSSLMNNVSAQLPSFMLAYYFSPAIVGYYALGYRVVKSPISIIGTAIARVFYQKASEEKNRTGSITVFVEEVFNRLVALCLYPLLVLALLGQNIFTFVFGAEWVEAGIYLQLLIPWVFMNLISAPISTIFNVLEKQWQLFLFNLILLLTRAVTLAIGGVIGDPRLTLCLFSVSGALIYGWLCLWIMSKSGIRLGKVVLIISRYLLFSLPFLVIYTVLLIIKVNQIYLFVTVVVISIVYLIIIIKKDPVLYNIIFKALKNRSETFGD